MNPQLQGGLNIPLWLKLIIGLIVIVLVVYGAMKILNEGKIGGITTQAIKSEEQVGQSLTKVSTNVVDIKSRLDEIDKSLG